jgi:UDP-2,3-diacylglucosamine hydrolase
MRDAPHPDAPWQVPGDWAQVDFISDLHLAPTLPRTLAALRLYLRDTRADALVILGDLFEVWVGDDARESDFEAECTALLRDASRRRPLAFMAGNRDFLLGPAMAGEAGLRLLPDPMVMVAWGRRVLLTHGDAWCLDDAPYQQFRRQVRSAAWQAAFLGRPLAERRAEARRIREESQRRKEAAPPADWADVDRPTAIDWLQRTHCDTLIHGHTHRPVSEALAPGLTRHVLSDWDLDDARPPRADVLEWRPTGLQRRSLTEGA